MQDVTTAFTLTLDQATEGWILHLKARNLSPMTIKAYRAAAAGLAGYLRRSGMPDDLDQITGEHIEAYIADEVATKAPATAHQRYRGLKHVGRLLRCSIARSNLAQSPW